LYGTGEKTNAQFSVYVCSLLDRRNLYRLLQSDETRAPTNMAILSEKNNSRISSAFHTLRGPDKPIVKFKPLPQDDPQASSARTPFESAPAVGLGTSSNSLKKAKAYRLASFQENALPKPMPRR